MHLLNGFTKHCEQFYFKKNVKKKKKKDIGFNGEEKLSLFER